MGRRRPAPRKARRGARQSGRARRARHFSACLSSGWRGAREVCTTACYYVGKYKELILVAVLGALIAGERDKRLALGAFLGAMAVTLALSYAIWLGVLPVQHLPNRTGQPLGIQAAPHARRAHGARRVPRRGPGDTRGQAALARPLRHRGGAGRVQRAVHGAGAHRLPHPGSARAVLRRRPLALARRRICRRRRPWRCSSRPTWRMRRSSAAWRWSAPRCRSGTRAAPTNLHRPAHELLQDHGLDRARASVARASVRAASLPPTATRCAAPACPRRTIRTTSTC